MYSFIIGPEFNHSNMLENYTKYPRCPTNYQPMETLHKVALISNRQLQLVWIARARMCQITRPRQYLRYPIFEIKIFYYIYCYNDIVNLLFEKIDLKKNDTAMEAC